MIPESPVGKLLTVCPYCGRTLAYYPGMPEIHCFGCDHILDADDLEDD